MPGLLPESLSTLTDASGFAGRCALLPEWQGSGPDILPLGVRLRVEGTEPQVALLDTAAAWSVLPSALLESLGVRPEDDPEPIVMSTRLGSKRGALVRLNVTLDADEGQALTWEVTFFASREWDGPLVLGWRRGLECLCIALDGSRCHLFFSVSEPATPDWYTPPGR
jgi:hypothetical protein